MRINGKAHSRKQKFKNFEFTLKINITQAKYKIDAQTMHGGGHGRKVLVSTISSHFYCVADFSLYIFVRLHKRFACADLCFARTKWQLINCHVTQRSSHAAACKISSCISFINVILGKLQSSAIIYLNFITFHIYFFLLRRRRRRRCLLLHFSAM